MKKILILTYTILLAVFVSGTCQAFSNQDKSTKGFTPDEIIRFAKKVEKEMAAKGARIAIVARVGRPKNELPEGISFTHVGFAVYSKIKTPDGRVLPGYAMYNLYQRAVEPDVSDLIKDFPADFFAGVNDLEAGIIIPTPELQKRLLKVIASDTYAKLHVPQYSVLANPFTLEYQNCTEHILDVIMAAIYETDDINKIKANEKAYFEALEVKESSFKLLMGSWFMKDLTLKDHQGKPVVTTFTTIAKFLEKFGAAQEVLYITATES